MSDAFQGRSGEEGAVGHGWGLAHDIVLSDSDLAPQSKRLLPPPNSRINFAWQSDGSDVTAGDPCFGMTASFLLDQIDPAGNVTSLERRTDPVGRTIRFAHDAKGKLSTSPEQAY